LVRNITGSLKGASSGVNLIDVFELSNIPGAFYAIERLGYATAQLLQRTTNLLSYCHVGFDASLVVPTASENRVNNVAYLPLIAY